MRILRGLGNAILWLVAALGVLSVLVWGATQLGYIKPLVVISGSMEPGIMTGDLIVDVQKPTADVKVGEVTSIYSPVTRNLVSHRIVGIEPMDDGRWSIEMKGDANDAEDGGAYIVDDHVWQPALQISGGGYFVTTLTKPSVAVPLGFTLLCLLALSMLPPSQPRARGAARVATVSETST
ncbi:MAG TPA: signal peptidase I [Cellulomonas sp.]|nr:signal peptidase I [Cellulomonas sp.]